VPIFIAGPDGWRDMARRLAVGLVLRVDADGRIFASEALHKRLEYLGKAPEIVVVQ
jgi:thiamine biosynthesis lipoprotein